MKNKKGEVLNTKFEPCEFTGAEGARFRINLDSGKNIDNVKYVMSQFLPVHPAAEIITKKEIIFIEEIEKGGVVSCMAFVQLDFLNRRGEQQSMDEFSRSLRGYYNVFLLSGIRRAQGYNIVICNVILDQMLTTSFQGKIPSQDACEGENDGSRHHTEGMKAVLVDLYPEVQLVKALVEELMKHRITLHLIQSSAVNTIDEICEWTMALNPNAVFVGNLCGDEQKLEERLARMVQTPFPMVMVSDHPWRESGLRLSKYEWSPKDVCECVRQVILRIATLLSSGFPKILILESESDSEAPFLDTIFAEALHLGYRVELMALEEDIDMEIFLKVIRTTRPSMILMGENPDCLELEAKIQEEFLIPVIAFAFREELWRTKGLILPKEDVNPESFRSIVKQASDLHRRNLQ